MNELGRDSHYKMKPFLLLFLRLLQNLWEKTLISYRIIQSCFQLTYIVSQDKKILISHGKNQHINKTKLLVTVINNKNSIIAHKLKENIELVQSLCNMDRNYRRKRVRTQNVQIALSRGFYDRIDLTPITDQCERLEGDETLVELLAPLDKSCQNLYDVNFSSQLSQFESEMISDVELDKLILNAADLLGDTTHSSTKPQLCEPIKLEAERESESPTVDDADLQITINSILTDLAREDIKPKENGSIVITDSSTGIELLKYRTEPISHVGNVFKHNMQQSWIKSP